MQCYLHAPWSGLAKALGVLDRPTSQLYRVTILRRILKRLMTLTLDLSPELEQYLLQEANQQGLSVEALALQLLANSILLKQKQTEVVNLLQSWIDDENGAEQQETGQYLIHALDNDRLSERKLFPLEMKGITW